jgi:ABC-type transport system substrate-binding protein
MMGGLYFATPEKLDQKLPFADKRVREAMNRAVNRKELINTLFGGRGLIYPVHGFLFGEPGWNPKWEEEFDKRYGYDPVRAKALLQEAGYPKGFSFKIYVYPWPGLPENIDVTQALDQYYRAVGLSPQMVDLEFPRVREIARKKEMHGALWSISAWAPSFAWYRFYNLSKESILFSYEHPMLDQIHAQLRQTVDPKERAKLLQAFADHKFEEYAEIPIVRLFVQVAVNPKVVAEYTFPGTTAGFFTHLEYVKAVK